MEFLNNIIIVFYVTHKFNRKVQIKGILDMDYYGEMENPLQYFDEDNNLIWHIPPNPYRGGSKDYADYNKLLRMFKANKNFIYLLKNCNNVQHHYFEGYDVEMEVLTWK